MPRPLPLALALAVATSAALAGEGHARGDEATPAPADGAMGHAATADVSVVRHGVASGCPGGAALSSRIDAVAGRSATVGATGADADVRVVVVFAPAPGGGLLATLDATGARTGQRVLADDDVDCVALADAVAVATALLLDAGWTATPVVPAEPAPPPPAPPASTWRPPPAWPTPARPEPEPPAFTLGAPTWAADLWVAFSTTLDAAGTASIGAMGRRRLGPVSVGAGTTVVLPTEARFGDGSVSAWAIGVAGEVCLDVHVEALGATLSPCGTSSLRSVLASGARYDENTSSALPMVGLGGAAELASRLRGPLSLVARGSIEGEVVRPTFRVDDLGGAAPTTVGDAYRPPGAAVEVGVGLRFEAK